MVHTTNGDWLKVATIDGMPGTVIHVTQSTASNACQFSQPTTNTRNESANERGHD